MYVLASGSNSATKCQAKSKSNHCRKQPSATAQALYRARVIIVPSYAARESQRWLNAAEVLTLSECENHPRAHSLICSMLRAGQDQLKMKNSHFGDLPYRFCRADSVQGCQEIMLLIRAKPFEEHNKITQRWIRKQGGDVNSLVFSTRLLRISFDLLYGFTT